MKMKKLTAMGMAALMAATMIPAVPVMAEGEGKVYYLNFKPEADEAWQNLAKAYTEETGTEVTVVTAASGQYETTLQSEMAKSDAPTLFQVNGPVGLKNWKDYCYDLKDSEIYSQLTSDAYALKDGESVPGIAYVIESYGLIVNKTLLEKAGYTLDDIKSYDQLKTVADDIQSKKDELGIKGAFTSAGMDASSDWRFKTHLANLPIYYEYKDDNVSDKDAIDFKYSDNFKNIFDLYLNNSCTDPKMVGAKTVEDSMAEFALGKVAMVQNGNWGWSQVAGVEGNTVKEEDVKFLPIYTGVAGEEKQGLCIGTENFFSINSQAKEEDQQASLDFLTWLFSSDTGKDYVTNKLGFIAPFDTFTADEKPTDPLAKEVDRYMSNTDLYSVSWNFTSFPSQTFKDNFGASLLQYAQGGKEWQAVVDDMKADWANEKAMTK